MSYSCFLIHESVLNAVEIAMRRIFGAPVPSLWVLNLLSILTVTLTWAAALGLFYVVGGK